MPISLCTQVTARDPSPTAKPTRFVEPARMSPAARIPGTVVSKGQGCAASAASSLIECIQAGQDISESLCATPGGNHAPPGSAPMKTNTAATGNASAGEPFCCESPVELNARRVMLSRTRRSPRTVVILPPRAGIYWARPVSGRPGIRTCLVPGACGPAGERFDPGSIRPETWPPGPRSRPHRPRPHPGYRIGPLRPRYRRNGFPRIQIVPRPWASSFRQCTPAATSTVCARNTVPQSECRV